MENSRTDKEFAKTMDKGNFEAWLKTVNLRNGGQHIVSGKGYGKSTALKHIARYYAKQPNTYVIIADTILNWCLSFDTCPYYTVREDAVQERTKNIEINDGKSYLVWAKEYIIDPEPFEFIDAMIKKKQQLILLNIELMEIDLVGTFQAKLIDHLYQKQRIKKKYHGGNLPEQYVLISEETEAVFDNSTLDRHTMSRTRKEFAEMANLRIAMFSCSQRLQEISTKFRGKMDSYLIGHTSIEDFDLKLNRMLKFSKHREDVLTLGKGEWLDTKTDTIVKFPDFTPNGEPTEYKFNKPAPIVKLRYAPNHQVTDAEYQEWFNEQKQQGKRQVNVEDSAETVIESDSREDSNGDGLFIADDDSQDLFPEEFP